MLGCENGNCLERGYPWNIEVSLCYFIYNQLISFLYFHFGFRNWLLWCLFNSTAYMSNTRYSFLLWNTYHFLRWTNLRVVLKTLLRGTWALFAISIKFYPKRCWGTYKDFAFHNKSIWNRVLLRSREIKIGKYDNLSDVAEQHRQQSLEKAKVIQWLCFTPPSTIANVKDVSKKLLLRALIHR